MMTVREALKDDRYNMACNFIVYCFGETEVFTREEKDKMIRIWGEEEARVYFLNTREVTINIL